MLLTPVPVQQRRGPIHALALGSDLLSSENCCAVDCTEGTLSRHVHREDNYKAWNAVLAMFRLGEQCRPRTVELGWAMVNALSGSPARVRR